MLLRITALQGNALDSGLAQTIHELEHRDCVEYVTVRGTDLARKRLRLLTDGGDECAIALPRDVALEHGDRVRAGVDHRLHERVLPPATASTSP